MVAKQALTIGINAYELTDLVLKPCRNDATDLSNSLRSIGFQVQNALDLNLNAMQSVTDKFINSIKPDALVMFYFSGHGVQCKGKNYLIPKNALKIHANNIDSTAIDVQNVIDSMYQRRPRLIVCILDCCRTQPPRNPLDKLNPHKRALSGTKPGLTVMQPPPSTIIVYACAANNTASAQSKNDRNSLYTYHLLRHIRTPNVDIETVLKRVAIDVQRDSNNKQIPYRYSSCNELIYLLSNHQPRAPTMRQFVQPKPIAQPLKRQYMKPIAYHYHDLQRKGQFGLPVYQHLPIQNKAPNSSRVFIRYGHDPARGFQHYYYR